MLFEQEQFHWMREWRVLGAILMIETIFIMTLLIYYKVFIDRNMTIGGGHKILEITLVVSLAIFNYLVFYSRDQWRQIVKEFEKWPKKKNQMGTLIVYSIILLIIANLIFAFYLLFHY